MDQPKETPPTSPTPAPVPEAPQQPVAPQPQVITAPEGQQVQYVVAKKSLEGLGGWLAVWLVVCGLGGAGYIGAALSGGESGLGSSMPTPLLFILGVVYFTTAVLVALRKRYGVWASIGSLAFGSLVTIVTTLTDSVGTTNTGSTVVVNVLLTVLFSLYFLRSERVKLTLTK